MTRLHFDFETRSEIDLLDAGVDRYARHPSTQVDLAAFRIDDEAPQQWLPREGQRMPGDLKEALRDPEVTKIAFNAQFERWITTHVLNIETPVQSWRCSQALAYMFSFMGRLDDVGKQMMLKHQKDARGKQLIRVFAGPNKPTKNQPFIWRDQHSDPDLWEEYKLYNLRDEDTEHELWNTLIGFAIPEWQWDLYHLDQIINDRGLPINRRFIENALAIATRRKSELISEQNRVTGLKNSNSGAQLLPWLKERGYEFDDLQKDTIAKVLAEEEEEVRNPAQTYDPITRTWIVPNYPAHLDNLGRVVGDAVLTVDARAVMRMRQASAKTSTTKYEAAADGLGPDDRLRHCFQFAGASRTLRWAGRKIQPQNLPRTPKWLEPYDDKPCFDFDPLDYCNDLILNGRYDELGLFSGEQMEAVAGCVRSSIQAPPGRKLVVCDLSSIESVVIGWLTGCERLLNVFRTGRCPYRDFATTLYSVGYDAVTKAQRSGAKPAVLGSGYRLSGGELYDGKKTGLWGYAEGMGITLSKEESHKAVNAFRETYHEIPSAWYGIENAIVRAAQAGGKPVRWGKLEFEIKKPFLRVKLPSGRFMYYYKLRVQKEKAISRAGNEYDKYYISYMGKNQVTTQWDRIESHGGKFIENFVQALARDILALGMFELDDDGFFLIGHVHDENIAEEDEDDNYHTHERMTYLMTERLREKYDWLKDMPLGAAGYEATVYRKD